MRVIIDTDSNVCGLQLHCLQFLIHELVSGGTPKKMGGFFSGSEIDIPHADMRQLENFFNKLAFFPHILDYRGVAANHPFDSQICSKFHKRIYSMSQHPSNSLS
jgi:hypothetical protein